MVLPQVVVQRGCGFRTAGSIYATAKTSLLGAPLDYFTFCPPWVIYDINEIGLAAQGVLIREGTSYGRKGIWDLWALVGAEGYPNATDFWMEASHFGFSWKVSKKSPIYLLSKKSRMIFVHSRAYIDNFEEPYKKRLGLRDCPREIGHHDENEGVEMCFSLLFETIGNSAKTDEPRKGYREFPVNVEPPVFRYQTGLPPAGYNPEYQTAAFVWSPIDALEVPEDKIEDTHGEAIKLLAECGTELPYYVTDE
jgi:hypothetical protein